MIWSHILIYLLSFAGIWIGSGIAIKSVEKLAQSLKLSSFIVSFVILGMFTSIGEMSVSINALLGNDPEIFIGSLIGASIVLFMLVAPLLAIIGNSIKVNREFRGFNLLASLIVVALPSILIMDGKIDRTDSLIAIFAFIFLLISLESRRSLLEKIKGLSHRRSIVVVKELLKTFLGMVVVFVASKFVIQQTVYFSEILGVSPFLISLLLISIGTNVPELSLAIRSIFLKNYQVAFGNYVGSAAFNTFLLGILSLIYGQPIFLTNSYLISLLFLIIGLLLFYYFARTKNILSRGEGVILLLLYFAFILMEVCLHF